MWRRFVFPQPNIPSFKPIESPETLSQDSRTPSERIVLTRRKQQYGWFWPDFFYALEVMGMVLGAVASALYIVDAHRKFSRTILNVKMLIVT